MFVITAILAILIFSYLKDKVLFLNQVTILLSTLLLFFFFLTEFSLTDLNFLNSDELVYTYARGEVFNYENKSSRLVWYLLNDFIFYYSGSYNWENKILSLPFLLLLNYCLYVSFPNLKGVSYAIILTPYLLFISVMDLRDVLIILLCFSALSSYVYGRFILFFFACLLLVFLRPFAILMVVLPLLFLLLVSSNVKIYRKAIYLSLFIIFSSFFAYIFSDKVQMYIYRMTFFLDGGGNESLQGETISFDPLSLIEYFIKFVFAPIPLSLFDRAIFNGGHEVFGMTDDLLRGVGQVVFYFLVLYFLYNISSFKKVFRSGVFSNKEVKLLAGIILFSIIWVFIYTFFSLGDAHTRVKVVHMLCISICCIFIYNFKRELK